MNLKMLLFFAVIVSATLISCSDDEKTVKGDPDLTHEGAQWKITSVDYMLIDQGTSGSGMGQTYKSGTQSDAGTFYFVDGGARGSFEMGVEGYNKEDYFDYTVNGESVSIMTIEQNVGVSTNQNVIVLSGSKTETTMALSGSIVKQSTTGQFYLEVEIALEKVQ